MLEHADIFDMNKKTTKVVILKIAENFEFFFIDIRWKFLHQNIIDK